MSKPFIYILFIVFFVVSSCSVFTRKEPKSERPEIDESSENINSFKYNNLSCGFKAHVTGNNLENEFKGKIRFKNDSIIWFSALGPLGIEAFRLYYTPDSLKAVNKLENMYYKGRSSTLNKFLGVNINFHYFQDILTGDYAFNKDSFILEEDSANVILKAKSSGINPAKILLDKHNYLIDKLVYLFESDKKYVVNYESYKQIENQFLPKNIELVYTLGELKTIFSIEYSNYKLSRNMSFDYSISDSYERMK